MPTRRVLALSSFCSLSFLVATVSTPSPAAAQSASLDAVAWFQGCWERSNGNRRTVERWLAPDGGEMRGWSRSFVDANETGGERLRLTVSEGALVYSAHPSSQAPQGFRATAVSPSEVVFENPAHDFPQRIIYQRRGSDSLVARIEGDRAGRQQPVSFAFRSIGCDGQGESPADSAERALRPHYADLAVRLKANPAGQPAWFVQQAAPTFLYVSFAAPGYLARRGSLATQQAAAQAAASRPAPTLAEHTVDVSIASLIVRSDTAEVMVVIRQAARTGPAGQQRLRASESRRLDRWVRLGGEWKLAQASLVHDETALDGTPAFRNGVPIAPRP